MASASDAPPSDLNDIDFFYRDKLKVIGGIDPYGLGKSFYSVNDVKEWPKLAYTDVVDYRGSMTYCPPDILPLRHIAPFCQKGGNMS